MAEGRPFTILFCVVWVLTIAVLWWYGASIAVARELFALTMLAYLSLWSLYFIASSRALRQKTMRFLAVHLPFAIVVAGLESLSLIGAVDYRRVFHRHISRFADERNIIDPELILTRRPHLYERGYIKEGDLVGKRGAAPTPFRRYDVRYDHRGFLNEVDLDEADLIVIGDSFVEAANMRPQDRITTRIADALDLTGVSLGLGSYGPQQELIVLKRYGVPLKPRICVWVFFDGNDLDDANVYVWLRENLATLTANYDSRIDRSFTKNAFDWLRRKLFVPVYPVDYLRSGVLDVGGQQTRMWFGYPGEELAAEDLTALDLTTTALTEAAKVCRENNIQFIVAFAPSKFRVYADVCRFDEASPIRQWVVNDLPQRLAERVDSIGDDVGFVDMTPAFQAAARQGAVFYYPSDTHWSAPGHELAARVISEYIRANYPSLLTTGVEASN